MLGPYTTGAPKVLSRLNPHHHRDPHVDERFYLVAPARQPCLPSQETPRDVHFHTATSLQGTEVLEEHPGVEVSHGPRSEVLEEVLRAEVAHFPHTEVLEEVLQSEVVHIPHAEVLEEVLQAEVARHPHTEVLVDHLGAEIGRHSVLLQATAFSQLADNGALLSSLQAATIASSSWLPAGVVLQLEPLMNPW